jgi:carbamoyl-phosphate synthase large subunit
VPASGIADSIEEAERIANWIGLPVIIRPSFTLGGTGGGVAYHMEEFLDVARGGLDASPTHEILIEQSVIGWKEFELEVMRDHRDNVVIICSIENLDPMGIHTGDSITVAPAQTLTDREYQEMRDAAIAIIRGIGVDTGGSNIQFAVNPENGEMIVIEMNPRVSRSSALASKATGFPIAKIAAKLAVGYTLDEIQNDITLQTPACFEPTIDYCVTKIPRFTFEKFVGAKPELTTSMRSVGEAMAIGRTFKESLQKALRSLEIGVHGLDDHPLPLEGQELRNAVSVASPTRIFAIKRALQTGMTVDEIYRLSGVDPWFLDNIQQIVEEEAAICSAGAGGLDAKRLRKAKEYGFSDRQLARLCGLSEQEIWQRRINAGVIPAYKAVDTCAAEFEAFTPYYYSAYERESET